MRFTRFRIFLCLALPMVFGFNLGAANRVIRGTLFPAYGETQLPDKMTITLSSQGVLQTAMSWGAGSFSFENVSEGSYVVTVTAPGRQSASAVVDVQGPGSFFVVSVVVGPPIEDSQNSPTRGAAVVDVATLRIPEKAIKAFEEGVSYLNKNESRKAEERLQRAISEYPHFHHAHNALGIVYTRSKRLKEAREEFTKAVEINPDSPGAQRNLGLVMLLQNEPAKAIGPLLAAARLEQSDPRSFDYLGEAYFLAGQPNEARQSFEKCLSLDPKRYEVTFRLGEVCTRTTDFTQALAYFKQVLKQNPPPELAAAAKANIEKLQSMVR